MKQPFSVWVCDDRYSKQFDQLEFTSGNTAQWLKWHCPGFRGSRRPSKEATVLQTDHRCQIPGAVADAKIRKVHRVAVADKRVRMAPVSAAPVADKVAVEPVSVPVLPAPASGFCGKTHPPAEYNDYTWHHLRRLGSSVVAMPAMRAACIARSNLDSRGCAK